MIFKRGLRPMKFTVYELPVTLYIQSGTPNEKSPTAVLPLTHAFRPL